MWNWSKHSIVNGAVRVIFIVRCNMTLLIMNNENLSKFLEVIYLQTHSPGESNLLDHSKLAAMSA